ncbi:MAG: type II toxin-antitoxin system PemK/MazF family toxin [Gammaproteobacteria bacterium]|nr:type II toxin-antitoxin system PemK/MazF family toxin [Gammaproteobacteria bacterium]MYD01217.1 type II toxin-antitoxin system PemK/MazF family toxin [Gammaproteobacteria bacterium]MYI25064.1 type II toxin-antitoxin system PemK/MazF family toxin [Gammaproteobacteria bacterium]
MPLPARMTRLPKESVANVSQIVTLDKALLEERVARIPQRKIDLLLAGIEIVLGR